MPSLKEIKGRIASVKSTLKITSAMKMVASAKYHKAQAAIGNMTSYEKRLHLILSNLLADMADTTDVLQDADILKDADLLKDANILKKADDEDLLKAVDLSEKVEFGDFLEDADKNKKRKSRTNASQSNVYMQTKPASNVAIIAFASNTSLCGSFNANAVHNVEKCIKKYIDRGIQKENIALYPVGKKMVKAMKKRGWEVKDDFSHLVDFPSYTQVADFATSLMKKYEEGVYDEIALSYMHFVSMATQKECQELFLPISMEGIKKNVETSNSDSKYASVKTQYIVEPGPQELMEDLLPKVLKLKIYTVCLDSMTAEHAARTVAMQTATDNGNEILDDLTLEYNKSRQQKITNELLDIIGGSLQ